VPIFVPTLCLSALSMAARVVCSCG
jgi:hypothetical protein